MNLLDSDIYQNRGFECSATILQVAPQNPLPAVPEVHIPILSLFFPRVSKR